MNEYDGIDLHSDRMYGPASHAAINVKVYASVNLPEHLEPFAQSAWQSVQEQFWQDAKERAHERGYSNVFAEGRSGGWMVPFYQYGMNPNEIVKRNLRTHPVTRAPLMLSWPGQGGGLGRPRYPDMDDIGERSRFRAFQREIVAMLDGVPAQIRAEAQFHYDETLEQVV